MTPTLLPVRPGLHLTDVGHLRVCHCHIIVNSETRHAPFCWSTFRVREWLTQPAQPRNFQSCSNEDATRLFQLLWATLCSADERRHERPHQLGWASILAPESARVFMLIATEWGQLWMLSVSARIHPWFPETPWTWWYAWLKECPGSVISHARGCQHRSCCVGRFTLCSNVMTIAVFGKRSTMATNETLSIGLVGVLLPSVTVLGLVASSFVFAFAFGLTFAFAAYASSCALALPFWLQCPCQLGDLILRAHEALDWKGRFRIVCAPILGTQPKMFLQLWRRLLNQCRRVQGLVQLFARDPLVLAHNLLRLWQFVNVRCVGTSTDEIRVRGSFNSAFCLLLYVELYWASSFQRASRPSRLSVYMIWRRRSVLDADEMCLFAFFVWWGWVTKYGVVLRATFSATSPKRGSTARRYATNWTRLSLYLLASLPSEHDERLKCRGSKIIMTLQIRARIVSLLRYHARRLRDPLSLLLHPPNQTNVTNQLSHQLSWSGWVGDPKLTNLTQLD